MSPQGLRKPASWPDTMRVNGRRVPRSQALRDSWTARLCRGRGSGRAARPPKARRASRDRRVVVRGRRYARWTASVFRRSRNGGARRSARLSRVPLGKRRQTAKGAPISGPDRPREVGSFRAGLSPFGCYDMGGNVREWLADAQPGEPRRAVAGGSWLDPVYMFEQTHSMLRSATRTRQSVSGWSPQSIHRPAGKESMRRAYSWSLSCLPVIWRSRPHTPRLVRPAIIGSLARLTIRRSRRISISSRTTSSCRWRRRSPRPKRQGLAENSFLSDHAWRARNRNLFSSAGARWDKPPAVILLHGGVAPGKEGETDPHRRAVEPRRLVRLLDRISVLRERGTPLLTTFAEQEKHDKLFNQPSLYLAWITQSVKTSAVGSTSSSSSAASTRAASASSAQPRRDRRIDCGGR